MREAILRFIARPQQYTLMPSMQLVHCHQAQQGDVVYGEASLTQPPVYRKIFVLSVEAADHSCRMDENATGMGVTVCAVEALQTYAESQAS